MSKKSDWNFLSLLRILTSEVVWVCLGSVPRRAKSPAGFPLWQGQGSSPSQSQRPERPLAEGPGVVSLLCPDEIWHGNSSLASYVDECFYMFPQSQNCVALLNFKPVTLVHESWPHGNGACVIQFIGVSDFPVHTVYLNFLLLWNPILTLIIQSFQTIPNLHLPQSTSIYFLHVLCFYLKLFLLSNHPTSVALNVLHQMLSLSVQATEALFIPTQSHRQQIQRKIA